MQRNCFAFVRARPAVPALPYLRGSPQLLRHGLLARHHDSAASSQATRDGSALGWALETLVTPAQEVSPVAQAVLAKAFTDYTATTPSVLGIVRDVIGERFPGEGTAIFHDHYAFRTFGVPGLGIASLAEPLRQMGYAQQQDCFEFPAKKLQATWFAPNDRCLYDRGLPRIFVSELEVGKLSAEAQAVIARYTSGLAGLPPALAIASLLTRTLPWTTPSLPDYQVLLKESEYAAWVLAHGYALNHSTISVHRLGAPRGSSTGAAPVSDARTSCAPPSVAELTELVRAAGFPLNQEGGLIKISPDGMLLQSSTVSDMVRYSFADGAVQDIAGSYIEFAERKPLKAASPPISEADRRDGFEVGNADKIFMSTTRSS